MLGKEHRARVHQQALGLKRIPGRASLLAESQASRRVSRKTTRLVLGMAKATLLPFWTTSPNWHLSSRTRRVFTTRSNPVTAAKALKLEARTGPLVVGSRKS